MLFPLSGYVGVCVCGNQLITLLREAINLTIEHTKFKVVSLIKKQVFAYIKI